MLIVNSKLQLYKLPPQEKGTEISPSTQKLKGLQEKVDNTYSLSPLFSKTEMI